MRRLRHFRPSGRGGDRRARPACAPASRAGGGRHRRLRRRRFHSERRQGLVGDHFSNAATIDRLPGRMAIGHVRYSTTGETILRNVQPLFAELEAGGLAVAHNGNLTNGLTLRRELIRAGTICQSTTDTEVVLLLAARSRRQQNRRPLRRGAGRDRRRLCAGRADQQEADRRARSARHPPAGARRARRLPDPRVRRPARSTSSAPNSSATSRTARSSSSTRTG